MLYTEHGTWVVGFNKNPETMKVIHLDDEHINDDDIVKVVEEHNFTTFTTLEDNGYDTYLTIRVDQVDGDYYLDVMGFDLAAEAVFNMDLRNELNFLYDVDNDKVVSQQIPLWKNRDKAKNSKQATKYVASRLSELFGNMRKEDVRELQEYADRHDVPLNLDIYTEFQKVFKTEHPNWNSSDGRCLW